MEYVAMIGLLFAPIVCLLCAAWFYVRWKNEHEDQELALRDRKTCFIFLETDSRPDVFFRRAGRFFYFSMTTLSSFSRMWAVSPDFS